MNNNIPWYAFMGAWGDAICSLGYFLWDAGEDESINVLAITPHQGIGDWLVLQRGVSTARELALPKKECYDRLCRMWYSQPPCDRGRKALGVVLQGTGIAAAEVRYLPIATRHHPFCPLPRDYDPVLPAASIEGARAVAARQTRPGTRLAVAHPYSFNSSPPAEHWRWWREAVLLAAERDNTVILTGKTSGMFCDDMPYHPNIIDYRDATDSMMDVFALCSESDFLITTANSVSHWGTLVGKPTLVCGIKAHESGAEYFRRWNESPSTYYIDWRSELPDFERVLPLVEEGRPRERRPLGELCRVG
jgi:hypothetical protein